MSSNKNNKEKQIDAKMAVIGAFLVTIVFLIAFSVYLFPWIIPFIWELPEGMTPAYYGILMALEMTPIVHKWKQAKMDFESN